MVASGQDLLHRRGRGLDLTTIEIVDSSRIWVNASALARQMLDRAMNSRIQASENIALNIGVRLSADNVRFRQVCGSGEMSR